MRRDSSAVILLELAASYALSYTSLSPHERQRIRLTVWRIIQQLSSFLALQCGRLGMWAEIRYREEALI